jgi:hypothetical protein
MGSILLFSASLRELILVAAGLQRAQSSRDRAGLVSDFRSPGAGGSGLRRAERFLSGLPRGRGLGLVRGVPLLLLEARQAVNAHHSCVPSADSGRRFARVMYRGGILSAESAPVGRSHPSGNLAKISLDQELTHLYDNRATEQKIVDKRP